MTDKALPSSTTYLQHCLKDGRLIRWPDHIMPISVYIAPFQWHEKSKQKESYEYHYMIIEAFSAWSKLSDGKVTFNVVQELRNSQIDVKWRRVDRQTLGHCEYMFNDQGHLYSAEIQIGISDGLVHPQYNSKTEVQHTVYHEIAHALGMAGHSDQREDIMYVPHQYGISLPSERDVATLKQLYGLPPGFDYRSVGQRLRLKQPYTIHTVIAALTGETTTHIAANTVAAKPLPMPKSNPEVLNRHHQILSQMGQFHLATQRVQVNPEVQKLFIQKRLSKPDDPSLS